MTKVSVSVTASPSALGQNTGSEIVDIDFVFGILRDRGDFT